MSAIGYIDKDIYGRCYIREIIPNTARPVEQWYNEEFASRCIEVPDDADQMTLYDMKTNTFYPWCEIEDDTYFSKHTAHSLLSEAINEI